MKEGWTYKKLGEVCKINSGKSIKASFISNDNRTNMIPCYGGNGLRGYVSESNSDGGKPIIGRVGAQCGNIHYCKTPFYATEHALVVSKISEEINPVWLCKLFEYMNLKQYAEGAAQPVIAASRLMILDIQFPSLEEQQQIVERLDSSFAHIDELKANAEKQLADAKALFQKALEKAMEPKEGWEEKKIGEICEIARGGSPRPIKSFITTEENGLNWIKIGDTDPEGKYIYETKEKIKPEGLKKSRWVEKDEFLLSNSMSFGRPYILKTNGCIHDGWLVLRDYQHCLNIDFFYYLLISPMVQSQFKTKAQGSTVSNLNTDRVSTTLICFPTLSEQQQIVTRLDSLSANIKALEENLEKTISECDALKQAILKETFE